MGIAIANQAKKMGANVKVIYTKKNDETLNCEYIYAPSADDILNESKKILNGQIFLFVQLQ